MAHQDIIKMLEQEWRDRLEAAVKQEREACAQVCENMACDEIYCQGFANAIRARQPLQNKPIDVGYYCVTCDRLILADGPCLASQPEQGAVAYIHRNEFNEYRLEPHDNFDIKSIPFNVDVSLFKLSRRKPLTNEQIMDACDSTGWLAPQDVVIDLARAIEAAHGIKEKNT